MTPDINDIIGGLGLTLLGIGLYHLHPAAGFITPGAILCLMAIWRASRPTGDIR